VSKGADGVQPTRRFNATRRAMKIMSRYGMRLIDERKAATQYVPFPPLLPTR
jgi:hypothetical protein